VDKFERTDLLLIISFIAVLVFPVLYASRSLDNNTLTSWQWVFRHGGAIEVFLLVIAATILSLLLSKSKPDPRWHPLMLCLASVAAVVPLWSEPEVILDAARYFSQAKHLELHGVASFLQEWGGEISAWTDLPAVPFAYGIVFRFLGETRLAIQCFTTLLFCLTMVSTFRIGRVLWSAETGFLAGLLLLSFPYLLTQVPLMLVDVPTMALVTLSLDAFLSALSRGSFYRSVVATVLIILAFAAKFSTWLMLPVLPVAAGIAALRGDKAAMRRAILILGAAAAAGGFLFAAKHEVIAGQLLILREFQIPGLARWRENSFSTFFFQIHPFIPLLAAYGVITAIRRNDIRFLIPAWSVLFVLVLQVERIRYLLPLFPLFALMAGYGLDALFEDDRLGRFTAFSAAGASLALVFCAYLPFLNSTTMANLRDAGRYLDSLPDEAVEVRVLPQQRSIGSTEAAIPLLDLFTRKRIVHWQGKPPRPNAQKLLTSSLRFTWEIGTPGWYAGRPGDEGLTRVIISSGNNAVPLSAGGTQFDKDTGTFRYRTVLTVLKHRALAQMAQ
jgi:hypothetical protein